ncbi:myrosinase 1-like [Epargyreus clarus]|uniref:myrosinase 1-like n=1 Tax=Epargyreus clarus TaxID=520877 RepID=UPI003C2FAF1D
MVPQVNHVIHQARAARAMLRPVLSSQLPTSTKLRVYKTYIRSRLTYAAPAWYALVAKSNRKRIQAQQNQALRAIVGAGRYVRNDVVARDGSDRRGVREDAVGANVRESRQRPTLPPEGYLLQSNAQKYKEWPSFPDDFMFGVATSAYQTEGAWDVDGRGISMWDHMIHTNPDCIFDKSNADIACNSYYLYKRDIEMLKELGVKSYRFSISWVRILPNGRANYINPAGIAHYNAIIDELIANDIVPFVTMYHWDLPQTFNELGGWLTEDIVEWFGDYARVLYENFGDRVKYWLTINEPFMICKLGYAIGVHAPEIKSPGIGFYECGRNVLLANAKAYHIYDKEFRTVQGGQVGLVVSLNWPEPASDSPDDQDAALSLLALSFRQYIDPIFSEHGNYPQLLIDRVAAASAEQNYNASRLRPFTDEQINYIKGTSDFFSLNTYDTEIVYRNESLEGLLEIPSMDHDIYCGAYKAPFVPLNGTHDLREYLPNFYKLLMFIKDNYNNPPIYIAENGVSTTTLGLNDDYRVTYIRNYLSALLAANLDGANVKGYHVWSLIDNFEWSYGYMYKMGLYEVDMSDPNRTRTPRKSAFVYKDIIRSGVVDYEYDPDPYSIDMSSQA